MRTLLLTLLVGCATADPPTVGDFVDDWAQSTCSRQIRCGWYAGTEDSCEDLARDFFCKSYDCGREYTPPQRITDCLVSYEQTACEDDIVVCKFP